MNQKILNVYTGSEITMCAPTHPYEAVKAAERMVKKIVERQDKEYHVNTNSLEAVSFLKMLCPQHHIKLRFHINGAPSTYEEVIADFDRGLSYIYHYQHTLQL